MFESLNKESNKERIYYMQLKWVLFKK